MAAEAAYRYDVYLSSCPEDADWAEEWLRPRLEAAGLHVGSESDFDLGVARVVNVERAVAGSRSTLLILTPAWVKSGWAEFESVLTQSRGIDDQAPSTLPLLLEPCQPPLRIAALSYADFTQAQRREAKLQQVIAAARGDRDIKMVGATLSQFLDNRGRMLQKVQSFWIEGVLESALQGQAALDLNLVDIPNAVPKAWTSVVDLLTNTPQPLPPGTPIDEVFDRHDGALLIFGGPGGGKTTLLLQLARALLASAEWNPGYPMPIVFNLSSWGRLRQPLADWLAEELNAKYDVPHKLGRAWVAEDQIIALLDGLDEVEEGQRAACADAINAFRKEHGFMRMAVCCRQAEYERLPRQLRLGGAVLAQPLTPEQIDAYLARGGEPLVGLRAAVHVDLALQELAQSPLMLGIMIGAYRGQRARALLGQGAAGGQQKRLFAAYVDRMFARRSADALYSREQTERWLAWLARAMQRQGQSVFLIEGLQPDRLKTQAARTLYTLLDRLGFGLIFGTTLALLFGWLGLLTGLLFGIFGGANPAVAQSQKHPKARILNAIKGLFVGGLLGLGIGLLSTAADWLQNANRFAPAQSPLVTYAPLYLTFISFISIGAIIGGLAGALIGSPSIEPRWITVVERLRWSWNKAQRSAISALAFGLLLGVLYIVGTLPSELSKIEWSADNFQASGATAKQVESLRRAEMGDLTRTLSLGTLGFSLGGALLAALIGGLENGTLTTTATPNQGIRRSARSATMGALLSALLGALVTGVPVGLSSGLVEGLEAGILTGLLGILIGSLAFGGYALLSHLALRFVLWRSGAMPWRYADFLDYAASRVFLRKVGGGYIFVHRMLLEYFADLPDAQPTPISVSVSQRAAERTALE